MDDCVITKLRTLTGVTVPSVVDIASLSFCVVSVRYSHSQVFLVRCPDGIVRASKEVVLAGFDYSDLRPVLASFAQELYLLHKLQHDRIVSLYGAVACVDKLALVMEYMPRGSLRKVLDRILAGSGSGVDDQQQPVEFSTVVRECDVILQDVAEGMAFLHSR